MKATGEVPRYTIMAPVACVLLSAATASAQQPRELGAATFVAPPGWTVDSRPNMQAFTWTNGRDRCMVAVAAAEPSPPALDAAFAAAWAALFSTNYRRAELPASVERQSPAGHRHAVGEGEIEDLAGNRLRARLLVFPLGTNSQWVVLIGNGAPALANCGAGWNAFLASLRFRSVNAAAASSAAAPAAAPPGARAVTPGPPATTTSGPQRFDNITFLPPPGWTVRRANGLVQLAPSNARSVEKLDVLLLPGRVSSASLERELEQTWSEVRSLLDAQPMMTVNGRPYDPDEPAQTLGGVPYLRGEGAVRRADGQWDVYAYVFRAGNRVERAAVVTRSIRENLNVTNAALNPEYHLAIRELLFTMKFASAPQRALAPAGLRAGGIVGVWAGLALSSGRIQTNVAVFFDNGMAYFGPNFPLRGLHQIDPAVEQPAQRRYWGTYTWSGGAGVLTMPYGTIPLRSTGAALELTTNRTAHRYIRLMMPPTARLDGTWCASERSCLRLTAQGRFEDTGAVRAVEHEVYPWPAAPARGEGNYTLRDHTLVLAYDGGPELRLAFPGLESTTTSSPSTLRLGFRADVLTRR